MYLHSVIFLRFVILRDPEIKCRIVLFLYLNVGTGFYSLNPCCACPKAKLPSAQCDAQHLKWRKTRNSQVLNFPVACAK
jgi:hypothetical protein